MLNASEGQRRFHFGHYHGARGRAGTRPQRSLAAALVIAGVMCGTAAAAPVNLLTNADFQTNDFTGWTIVNTEMGSGIFTPSTNYFAVIGTKNWTGASIAQSFQTIAGNGYEVSFDGATEPIATWPDHCWTGATIYDGSGTGGSTIVTNVYHTNSQTAFVNYSFAFTATSSQSTLKIFDNGDSQYYDNLIDNVSVVATPEPATLTLLALGGLAILRRRRAARP